jgi:hypothetical protein
MAEKSKPPALEKSKPPALRVVGDSKRGKRMIVQVIWKNKKPLKVHIN